MSPKWTETDLSRFQANSGRGLPTETLQAMTKGRKAALAANAELLLAGASKSQAHTNKSNAVPVRVDNQRFDSKMEAKRYGELKLLKASGEVAFFLRQVPFNLPGNIRYVIDFLVFWVVDDSHEPDVYRVVGEDVKGFDNRVGLNKRKQVLELYGVDVRLVQGTRAR